MSPIFVSNFYMVLGISIFIFRDKRNVTWAIPIPSEGETESHRRGKWRAMRGSDGEH